jgi:hypothetical protein
MNKLRQRVKLRRVEKMMTSCTSDLMHSHVATHHSDRTQLTPATTPRSPQISRPDLDHAPPVRLLVLLQHHHPLRHVVSDLAGGADVDDDGPWMDVVVVVIWFGSAD